jgi:hypothetical protein
MTILDPNSLVHTLDNVNEKFLLGEVISAEEGLEVSRWIASLQGGKGSYRDMFAPTPQDFEKGIRVFTGEKLVCASARHIMGQEAARAVWLLGRDDASIREAYDKATHWMHTLPEFYQTGLFCCGRCSLSFWRHFSVAGFKNKDSLVSQGIQKMQDYRLGNGKWRIFPFYYAIYTLAGLELDRAFEELKYARTAMERYIHKSYSDPMGQRKTIIIKKALEKIS